MQVLSDDECSFSCKADWFQSFGLFIASLSELFQISLDDGLSSILYWPSNLVVRVILLT